MNTWTCKVFLPALAGLFLAGCEAGTGLPLFGESQAKVLRSAELSQGAVMLVAPQGFCIDPRSLRARFALMARCDTLGAAGATDAPLALITATTVAAPSDALDAAQTLETDAETVLEQQVLDGATFVRVQGTPPGPGLDDIYWRAARVIGTQIVGLAIYEAADSARLGPQAPRLLEQTMRRTQAQTSGVAGNSATQTDNNQRVALQNGLFE